MSAQERVQWLGCLETACLQSTPDKTPRRTAHTRTGSKKITGILTAVGLGKRAASKFRKIKAWTPCATARHSAAVPERAGGPFVSIDEVSLRWPTVPQRTVGSVGAQRGATESQRKPFPSGLSTPFAGWSHVKHDRHAAGQYKGQWTWSDV